MFIDKCWESFVSKLDYIYSEPLIVVTLFAFLLVATYTDIKEWKIPNWLNGFALILRVLLIPFAGMSYSDVLGGILGLLFLLIPAMIVMHRMGGDIKASAVLGFYFGIQVMPIFLFISSALLMGVILITYKRKKLKIMPFAPFFLAAHTILFLASFVL